VLVGCEFSWTDLVSVLAFFETDGPSLSDRFASTFLFEDVLLGGMSQRMNKFFEANQRKVAQVIVVWS